MGRLGNQGNLRRYVIPHIIARTLIASTAESALGRTGCPVAERTPPPAGPLGVSQAQAGLSRKIGIPLSRSGRQRRAGRMVGCALPLVMLTGAGLALWRFLVA